MSPRSNLFICAAALSLLTACDDPPRADDSIFQKTLQGYYDSHPVCAAIPLTFPVDLRSDGDAARKRQLEPLVAAGLIAGTTIQKNEPAASGQEQATDYLRYAPTAAGEKVVRKGADSFLGGTDICFARRKVVKIESFTEPADAAGEKVSRVTYAYELKDVEPWATGPDIAGAFPQIATLLAKPGNQATDVLVQTDNGWKHECDVR
ncbi:MAG: hypothetical protein QHD01_09355 [Bradyrhizobium sp.]|uniref:hypothetical protein n=1 Tax=Bradyrhizobium sp. TaxID=376 RepID=UPI0029B86FD8|nr:hypothetical protein [Bradyrhizobium sp.]MDX3966792.1 hypothetical protein [Bradyrhizobium sp.]